MGVRVFLGAHLVSSIGERRLHTARTAGRYRHRVLVPFAVREGAGLWSLQGGFESRMAPRNQAATPLLRTPLDGARPIRRRSLDLMERLFTPRLLATLS